ncbi:MAG TPA: hypothetical protein VHF22_14640, partial [Planctomycetota bacterium]|nr:hypothetical protein [Planctomycetota bacterium]
AVCVASGFNSNGPLGFVEMMDDAPGLTPTWTALPTPFKRYHAAVVGVDDRLLVIGGIDENGQGRTEVWELIGVSRTSVSASWAKRADISQPRVLAGAFVLDRIVHIVSGADRSGTPIASEDTYNLDTGVVATVSSPTAIPTARYLPQCFVIGNRALVYDARTAPAGGGRLDSYTVAEGWTSRAAHPNPLNGPSGAVINGQLLVAGGGSDISQSQSHLYDPATDAWTALPNMSFARNSGFLGTIGGKSYYCGGVDAHKEDVKYDTTDFLGL